MDKYYNEIDNKSYKFHSLSILFSGYVDEDNLSHRKNSITVSNQQISRSILHTNNLYGAKNIGKHVSRTINNLKLT